jgi:hypothetical protein
MLSLGPFLLEAKNRSFLDTYRPARNYQNFSDRLKGLFRWLSGNLLSFQHSVQQAQGGFMAKQTRITIETDSLLILRGRSSVRAWCSRCAAEVEMIALEDMGVISNLDPPELEEWLNSGELHRLQATGGLALICLNSLLARVQKTTTIQPGGATKKSKETK